MGSEYGEEKRCCTVCDAKKQCHVCGNNTLYACADCRIDFGVTVYVCPKCRNDHEEKCSARLREALTTARREQREADRLTVLEQRCERGTTWDAAVVACAAAIRGQEVE